MGILRTLRGLTGSPLLALALVVPQVATAGPVAKIELPADGFLTLDQLKARYQDKATRYERIGGMAIRYKVEGKGPAIVLLHGSHSSLDGYDGLAQALSSHYRVIRFDMPGMGLSDTLPVDADTDTPFADDILKVLLERLGVEQAILVGVSSGGAVAYTFASRFPDRVRAMVLSNTPSEPVIDAATPRTPELRAEMDKAKESGFRSRQYWSVYLNWLTGTKSRLSEDKIDRYYDMNRRQPVPHARLFWRSAMHVPALYQTLATVKTPTLLVWGRIDYVLPLWTMDSLKRKLPAASVSTIELPDVGHYPPFEIPERFAEITKTYAESVVQSDRP